MRPWWAPWRRARPSRAEMVDSLMQGMVGDVRGAARRLEQSRLRLLETIRNVE